MNSHFILIDIKTHHTDIKQKLHEFLTKELGLSTMIWGVRESKPIICNLPENTYHIFSHWDEKILCNTLTKFTKDEKIVGCEITVVKDSGWTQEACVLPELPTSTSCMNTDTSSDKVDREV